MPDFKVAPTVNGVGLIRIDGSTPLTADWDIGASRKILADTVAARSASGLRLEDDAGNLGVFVIDGGSVGIGTTATTTALAKLEVRGGTTSVIRHGAGVSPSMRSDWTVSAAGMSLNVYNDNTALYQPMILRGTPLSFWHGTAEMARFDANGWLGIGITDPIGQLEVFDNFSAPNAERGITTTQINNGVHAPLLNFMKARGTRAAKTTLASGDAVAYIQGFGWDSASWLPGFAIEGLVNGTVAVGTLPVDLLFLTGPTSTVVERMRILSGGNVGIANTSPDTLLHVGPGVTATLPGAYAGLIVAPNSVIAGLTVKATGGQEMGMFAHSNNNTYVGSWSAHPLVLRTSNADRIYIDTAGLVGVGPQAASATNQLHVWNNQNAGTGFVVQNDTAGTAALAAISLSSSGAAVFQMVKKSASMVSVSGIIGAGDGYLYNNNYGDIAIRNGYTAGAIKFAVGASTTPMFAIDNTGNMTMHTVDLEAWSTGYRAIEWFRSAIMVRISTNAGMYLCDGMYYDGLWKYKAAVAAGYFSLVSGTLAFYQSTTAITVDTDAAPAVSFLIDVNGRVGIGTSTPVASEGNSYLTVQGTDATAQYLVNLNTGAGQVGYVLRRTGGTAARWLMYSPAGSESLVLYGGNPATNAMYLSVSPTAGPFLGINTVPSYHFHFLCDKASGFTYCIGENSVDGASQGVMFGARAMSANFAVYKHAPLNVHALGGAGAALLMNDTRGHLCIINAYASGNIIFCAGTTATAHATINTAGALIVPYIWNNAVAGTAVHINANGILTKTTSSIRNKTDVRAMPKRYAQDFVMALRPVIYKAKADETRQDNIGFIAEEVQEAGGEVFISRNNDGQVESLHYDRLTAPLVATVQELVKQVQEMTPLLQMQSQRIEELERRLGGM